MSLVELSATQLKGELEAGRLTSLEVTQAFVDRAQRYDPQIGAFLRLNADSALEQARAIDERRRQKQPVGPLAGVPVAVKDLLCSRGELTTCASKMLANFRPPYDATVVARLKAADAVLLGRTNMDEFAMGGSTENSAFQKTRNPWDLERTPGGSSGGAAACVAASMVPLSIGTDTGGSIREPAALNGLVGLKPTFGLVSRFGVVPLSSSLDHAGPITRTV
ncbi:MAG TPA: amidase, partial [Pirellulales bacterium]